MLYPKIIQNVSYWLQKVTNAVSKIGITLPTLINMALVLAIVSEISVFLVSYIIQRDLALAIMNTLPGLIMAVTVYCLRKPYRGKPLAINKLYFIQTIFLLIVGIKLVFFLFVNLPAVLLGFASPAKAFEILVVSGLSVIGAILFIAFLGFINCHSASTNLKKI